MSADTVVENVVVPVWLIQQSGDDAILRPDNGTLCVLPHEARGRNALFHSEPKYVVTLCLRESAIYRHEWHSELSASATLRWNLEPEAAINELVEQPSSDKNKRTRKAVGGKSLRDFNHWHTQSEKVHLTSSCGGA